LKSTVNTEGNSKFFEYDLKGRLIKVTDEKKNDIHYKYDIVGNLIEVIDANGHSIKYCYDLMNNLIEVHRYGKILDETIQKMYDGITLENEPIEYITKYEYDKVGNIIKEINPTGLVTEFSYDEAGNNIAKKDREGFYTTFEYNALNKLTKVKFSEEKEINYEYNELGHLVTVTDWLGVNKFELDFIGRVKKLKDFKNRIVEYGWNESDEKEYMIYPDGNRVNYSYDVMGRLDSILESSQKTTYKYDEIGRVSKHIMPDGTTKTYEYDKSKLTKLVSIKNDEIIDDREFSYDIVGNKTYAKINGEQFHYKYDKMNQLIEESKSKCKQMTKYFYDSLGNRRKVEDYLNKSIPDSTIYEYDLNEHLIGIKGKRTNLFGNEVFDPSGIEMTYDKR
jgi:YD repeat-containing protein